MAMLTCQIVRPDRLLYEGEATSIVLSAVSGELGVYPGHAAEVCALGNGITRINVPDASSGERQLHIVTMGGYAEVANDMVIVLAAHAREISDIDLEAVRETRRQAEEKRDALPEGDHGRAYFEEKIAWCDLLEKEASARS
ncbi:ATP synthase F1 subunit epsilon [Olsenella sp. Marseille-QA0557]|uniref:ATP synthase F1 subunit epsilon n=1 Tax=Olsenella sp. Marseille-QA0557 TaxID=3378782 RepID=UPI003D0B8294